MQRLIDANKLANNIFVVDSYSKQAVIDQINEAKPVLTIPDNPTNGNMQLAILPKHWEWGANGDYIHIWGDGQTMTFTLDWWNSPYKAESEE